MLNMGFYWQTCRHSGISFLSPWITSCGMKCVTLGQGLARIRIQVHDNQSKYWLGPSKWHPGFWALKVALGVAFHVLNTKFKVAWGYFIEEFPQTQNLNLNLNLRILQHIIWKIRDVAMQDISSKLTLISNLPKPATKHLEWYRMKLVCKIWVQDMSPCEYPILKRVTVIETETRYHNINCEWDWLHAL